MARGKKESTVEIVDGDEDLPAWKRQSVLLLAHPRPNMRWPKRSPHWPREAAVARKEKILEALERLKHAS